MATFNRDGNAPAATPHGCALKLTENIISTALEAQHALRAELAADPQGTWLKVFRECAATVNDMSADRISHS